MLFKTCLVCKNKFRTFPSNIKRGGGKFCSQKCSQVYHVGENHPLFGKKHSEETIKKIKKAVKGKSARYWLGKHHSPETREKISKNNYWLGRTGKRSARWKGGRRVASDGYILIYKPNHPRSDQSKYVKEHLLVAEKCLGRPVDIREIIHHINEVKADNRPENLFLFPDNASHLAYHNLLRRNLKDLIVPITKSNLPL